MLKGVAEIQSSLASFGTRNGSRNKPDFLFYAFREDSHVSLPSNSTAAVQLGLEMLLYKHLWNYTGHPPFLQSAVVLGPFSLLCCLFSSRFCQFVCSEPANSWVQSRKMSPPSSQGLRRVLLLCLLDEASQWVSMCFMQQIGCLMMWKLSHFIP